MTRKELLKKLKLIEPKDDEERNKLVCTFIGHSKIQTLCFGCWSCARCDTQIGDSLGGVYKAEGVVIVGHDCSLCRDNYKKLTWKDKLYCPDPFRKSKESKKQIRDDMKYEEERERKGGIK